MKKIKIGLLREERIPSDRRVALTPQQCKQVMHELNVEIVVQPSDVRCYTNKEYTSIGIELQEDLSNCDILLGIKEVPPHLFIANKTYLIFSHTIKQQAHNRKLLQAVLQNNVRLIDYEALVNTDGQRIIAFGYYAGLVGCYNGLMMYGKRTGLFELKRAFKCHDYDEMKAELFKIKLPSIKIAVTGSGRVARGVIEILDLVNIQKVEKPDYISKTFEYPVYVQLKSEDYHQHKNGLSFDTELFHKSPEMFVSSFRDLIPHTDLLIAAAFWNPQAPKLFTAQDMKASSFNLKVIADITCDIGGSIPSTIRPSTIDNPAYDCNRNTGLLEPAFSDEKNITVMAIDNLPGEIPRMASEGFGIQLMENVLPHLIHNSQHPNIQSGIVAENGALGARFGYLQAYVGMV